MSLTINGSVELIQIADNVYKVITAAVQGPAGPAGSPGPNEITTDTTTELNGYLVGNGSTVNVQATPIPASDLPDDIVYGPFASNDDYLASFDGTSGKLLQDSGLFYDNSSHNLSTGSSPGWSVSVNSNKATINLSSNDGGITSVTLTSDASGANFGSSNVVTTGSITGSGFSGSGASLTSLNATNLSTGTVADARLSANVPLKNAANTFTASQTVVGTEVIRFPTGTPGTQELQVYHDGTDAYVIAKTGRTIFGHPTSSGFQGGFLSLGQIFSNLEYQLSDHLTLDLAGNGGMRMRDTYTMNWGNGSNYGTTKDIGLARDSAGVLKVTNGSSGSGSITASTFSGSGASLTSLNATNLSTGTVADARLSANVALLASPTFTGTPLAPTATAGTNTTQIATTAFVTTAVAGGGGGSGGLANDFRLSTESNTPISILDRTAQSTIYLTPYIGNKIHLYDGAAWVLYSSAEVSLALSGLTNDKNYDVFAYYTGSAVALELTVWTNDTTRATAITRQDGVYVKSGTATRRLIGTIRTTSTTTTEDSEVKPFVANACNQVPKSSRSKGVLPASNFNATSTSFAIVSTALGHGVLTSIPSVGSLVTYATCSAGGASDGAFGYSINAGSGIETMAVIAETQVSKTSGSCFVGLDAGYNVLDLVWRNIVGAQVNMPANARGLYLLPNTNYISVLMIR